MSNISSLEQLVNDTMAEVTPLNTNFETLRVSVNDNDSRITKLKTETGYNFTQVNTTITKTKEELNESINNLTENKANKDLSNVNASNLTNFIKFDYDNPTTVIVNTTYKAEKLTALYGTAFTNANGQYDRIYCGTDKNNMQVLNYSHQASGDGRAGSLWTPHYVIIPKGYYFKVTGNWTSIQYAENKES